MRILIVDDETVYRDRLRSVLERTGHSVAEAESGGEALKIVESEPIDLVITDVVMPDVDGFELVRKLKRDYPDIEAIVLSSSDYSQDEVFLRVARLLGAAGAFKKSVTGTTLLRVIDTVAPESPKTAPSRPTNRPT